MFQCTALECFQPFEALLIEADLDKKNGESNELVYIILLVLLIFTTEDDDRGEKGIFGIVHLEHTHSSTKVEQRFGYIGNACTTIVVTCIWLIVGIYDRIGSNVILA